MSRSRRSPGSLSSPPGREKQARGCCGSSFPTEDDDDGAGAGGEEQHGAPEERKLMVMFGRGSVGGLGLPRKEIKR